MASHRDVTKETQAEALAEVSHPVAGRGFDETIFKAVMRKLAGAVCVISTSSDEGLHGLTATAVCSVCAEPPTILIVVNKSSRTHPHIVRKGAFTVNILAEEQRHVADMFASKTRDQFANIEHRHLADRCPVIEEAAAFLHCTVEQQCEVGTHTVFIGRVLNGGVSLDRPLVYHDAKYHSLSEIN